MAKMSAEQKLAAVERYLNGKESSRTVAAAFGISHRYLPNIDESISKKWRRSVRQTIYKLHKSI